MLLTAFVTHSVSLMHFGFAMDFVSAFVTLFGFGFAIHSDSELTWM